MLLVLGAGPKGVAIGSKRACLDNADLPECLVLERDEVGAHWSGNHNYTDGNQRLVTPPEHDVGFPYKSHEFFLTQPDINDRMQALSWSAFLVDTHQSVKWLHSSHKAPTHKEFVRYLKWVHDKSAFNLLLGTVHQIRATDDEWLIDITRKDNGNQETIHGQGLVISGHGGPKRLGGKGYANPRIADGRNFWERLHLLGRKLKPKSVVGVVGSGETAGAIALAILEVIEKKGLHIGADPARLMLIGKQPSYFLRSDLAKDVEHFSDPFKFSFMEIPERKGIIQRADRGVVSGWVKRRLEESDCVSYVIAEAVWPDPKKVPRSGKVSLSLKYAFKDDDVASTDQEFDYLVFAWGFDDLWFLKLFDDPTRERFLQNLYDRQDANSLNRLRKAIQKGLGLKHPPKDHKLRDYLINRYDVGDINSWIVQRLQHEIIPDLSVDAFAPKLHLPRLSGLRQGPGFPNLNCLGLLSDRIWASYL